MSVRLQWMNEFSDMANEQASEKNVLVVNAQ